MNYMVQSTQTHCNAYTIQEVYDAAAVYLSAPQSTLLWRYTHFGEERRDPRARDEAADESLQRYEEVATRHFADLVEEHLHQYDEQEDFKKKVFF